MHRATYPICWVVSDGRAGIRNQALGLAGAVAELTPLKIEEKNIVVREPWRSLPPWLWGNALEKLGAESDPFGLPWPDMVISTGRLSVPVSLEIKQRNPNTFLVQTQNPRFAHRNFDLIIPPLHDGVTGDNIFPILGAPNRITAKKLNADTKILETKLPGLKRPVVSVVIGGPNNAYDMTEVWATRFAQEVIDAIGDHDLLITYSRRTPSFIKQILSGVFESKARLISDPSADAPGETYYLGVLGVCDVVVVTCDSVNMITEAASTGRSIFIADLPVKKAVRTKKFTILHKAIENCGASKRWPGTIKPWTYKPLQETKRAAEEIVRRRSMR